MARYRRTRGCICYLIAAAAVFLVLHRLGDFAADDAFIHRRIAEHLLHTGHGYFNTHERVMVTSSPLWTIVLAGLAATHHLDFLVPVFEVFCIVMACSFAWQLGHRVAEKTEARAANVFGAIAALITFSGLLQVGVEQMEAPLGVGLFLLGVLLFEMDSNLWMAVLMLATAVRYEFYLMIPVALFVALLRHKLTWTASFYGALVLTVSNIWLLLQYGTLVPNTVRAKAIGYTLTFKDTMFTLGLGRAVTVGLLAIACLMFSERKRLPASAVVFFTFGMGLCAAYVSRKTFVFPWYQPLTRVPLMLGILFGPVLVCRSWIKLVPISLLAFLFLRDVRIPAREVQAAVTGQPWRDHVDDFNLRVLDYLASGRAIQAGCPNARLLTSEVGGLGYAFEGEILDGFGLATPAALKWHPMKVPEQRAGGDVGAIPVGFVEETHPDIVVTLPLFAEDLLRRYDASKYEKLNFTNIRAAGARLHPEMHVSDNLSILTVLVATNGACSSSVLRPLLDSALRATDQATWGTLPPPLLSEAGGESD